MILGMRLGLAFWFTIIALWLGLWWAVAVAAIVVTLMWGSRNEAL